MKHAGFANFNINAYVVETQSVALAAGPIEWFRNVLSYFEGTHHVFILFSQEEAPPPKKDADSAETSTTKTDWWTGSDYNGRKYASPKV